MCIHSSASSYRPKQVIPLINRWDAPFIHSHLYHLISPHTHTHIRRSSELIQTTNDKHADILWADYEDLDWDRILEGQVKANSYLVRKGLSRKAQLAYHLHKYLCKRPISCLKKAFPETLVIETWEAFEDEMTFGTLGAR